MKTFNTAYGPRVKGVVISTGKGMTKQSHKKECDVNLLMARYQKSGVVTHRNNWEPQYDDATGVDFQVAMNLVISSREMFQELPSQVRKEFDNDPAKFMDFVNNPENGEKMVEMGLANPKPEPEPPIEVVVKNQPPAPSETPSA